MVGLEYLTTAQLTEKARFYSSIILRRPEKFDKIFYLIRLNTLWENENERQKTKQVTIPLPRAAGSCFKAKKNQRKIFASLDFGNNPIYPI